MSLHGSGHRYGKLAEESGIESPVDLSTRLNPLSSRATLEENTGDSLYFKVGKHLIFNKMGIMISQKELDSNPLRREARLIKALESNDTKTVDEYMREINRLQHSLK